MYLIMKGSSPIYMSRAATKECAVEDYLNKILLRYQHEELTIHHVAEDGVLSCVGWIHNT